MKLYNDEFHSLYVAPDIITWVVKWRSRSGICVGNVVGELKVGGGEMGLAAQGLV